MSENQKEFTVVEQFESGHCFHIFSSNEEFVAWRRLPENRSKNIIAVNGRRGRVYKGVDHRNEVIEINERSVEVQAERLGLKMIVLSANERRSFEIWDR